MTKKQTPPDLTEIEHGDEHHHTPFVLHNVRISPEDMPSVEHIETHGDKWDMLFAEGVEKLVPMLPQIIQESASHEAWVCKDAASDAFAAFMLWPVASPPGIGSIIEHEAGSNTNEYATSYPVLEGADVLLRIKDVYTWENKLEGEVTAVALDEREITFFDCFYFKYGGTYHADDQLTFKLSALAYTLEPATDQGALIREGAFYDSQKQQFFEENPDAAPEDFPDGIAISFRGARLLIPREYASVYEFRVPILSVESFHLADELIYKLRVILCGEDDGLPCFLYVAAHKLGEYTPAAGDDIQGVCWLSGYLADEFTHEA